MNKIESKNREYHHKNLKEALIQTVLEMLEEKPLDAITVRELTNTLNVSRTAIYRHFSSKEHLFQMVILKSFDQLNDTLKPIYESGETIEQKFYLIGKSYIDFAMASPARYRLMMGDKLMKLREESCDIPDTSSESSFSIIVNLAQEAQHQGLFGVENPQVQAMSIWAMIHGQASLIIDGHPTITEQKEHMYELSFKILMQGLK